MYKYNYEYNMKAFKIFQKLLQVNVVSFFTEIQKYSNQCNNFS